MIKLTATAGCCAYSRLMRRLLVVLLLLPLLAHAQPAKKQGPKKSETPKTEGPPEPAKVVEVKPEVRIDGKAVVLRTVRLACEGTAYCEVQLFDAVTPCGETRPMRGQIFALPAVVGPALRLVPGGAPRIDLNDAEGANIDLGKYEGSIRVTAYDAAKHRLTFAIDLVGQHQNVLRGTYTGETCPS